MALITAASFAAAKPTIKNGSYSGGTPLPGSFMATYPNSVVPNKAPAPAAPAPRPAATSSGGGGGGTTATRAVAAPVYVDPYAAWGGQAGYNAAVGQVDSGLNNIRAGAGEAFQGAQSGLEGSAHNIFNNIRVGQQGIDTSRANNELNRVNGIQDILTYVRNGLHQGTSRLANGNALESSAATALAQAFSKSGNDKSRSVNNQAAIQSHTIDQNQNELNVKKENDLGDFHRQRDQIVNSIGADLRTKLAALDQTSRGLNLAGRVQVDQEKQRLIDQGIQKLQGVDSWLQGQLGGITPQNNDQVLQAAEALRTAGTANPNPFNTGIPAGMAIQGPAIDQLPIFVRSKRNT